MRLSLTPCTSAVPEISILCSDCRLCKAKLLVSSKPDTVQRQRNHPQRCGLKQERDKEHLPEDLEHCKENSLALKE